MENENFGPNLVYFALGITEGRPQVRAPGGPQEDPRTTPGRPQDDPEGPGTNPAPSGHGGGKKLSKQRFLEMMSKKSSIQAVAAGRARAGFLGPPRTL